MRRAERIEQRRTMRGDQSWRRVMTMGLMLVVLWMLIDRARAPETWAWLAGDSSAATETKPAKRSAEEKSPAEPNDAAPKSAEAQADAVAEGPTDTDPEELAAFLEDAQAIEDNTLGMGATEMPSYWRLVSWVQRQPLAVLKERASTSVSLHDLATNTKAQRGKLIRVDLHLSWLKGADNSVDNPCGVERMYEGVGPAKNSGAWMYWIATHELPPGLVPGDRIDENVRFYGYFFKLQAYHEAGAKPNAKPLHAPFLIGRIEWSGPRVARHQDSESFWTEYTIGAAGLFVAFGGWYAWSRFRRPKSPVVPASSGATINNWLVQAEAGEAVVDPYRDEIILADEAGGSPNGSARPNGFSDAGHIHPSSS